MSMQFPEMKEAFVELITQTSTNLAPDVRRVMADALKREPEGSRSALALGIIAENIDMACTDSGPLCQDTGWATFEIKTPVGTNQIEVRRIIREAVARATELGKLRSNSVDSLTGKNTGDNLGPGTPTVHFEQWESPDEIEVRLLLKGGGCENQNAQYALPTPLDHLGSAGRNLEGVRKAILHAVWKAQGKGCSAGAVGVCIGGDRASGYQHAKMQLFRTLDDVNPVPELAALESQIVAAANSLGIGTMGFGGDVTLLGCKIGAINRLPACFFVSVAYDCWAYRRLGVVLDAKTGAIKRWLYRDEPVAAMASGDGGGFGHTGAERVLRTPLGEDDVRDLEVGDIVLISGRMVTGRDAVHTYLMENDAPADLNGAVLYHCGPVVRKDGDTWTITAAGPTTSMREEPYQADIIGKFGIRAVMGKGGMGDKTVAGCKKYGAVYLNAIGGAAQFYARRIDRVTGVHLLEFGTPEAMWELEVTGFPAMVTIDSHGNSLHRDLKSASGVKLETLIEPVA